MYHIFVSKVLISKQKHFICSAHLPPFLENVLPTFGKKQHFTNPEKLLAFAPFANNTLDCLFQLWHGEHDIHFSQKRAEIWTHLIRIYFPAFWSI